MTETRDIHHDPSDPGKVRQEIKPELKQTEASMIDAINLVATRAHAALPTFWEWRLNKSSISIFQESASTPRCRFESFPEDR